MRISIRDERGQAVLEFMLTLIIAIAIIFGGLYQLNSAFKAWASNYFGDYLGCLLEAGELPSISGTGGDAGVCNRLFKPFSWSEGRRIAAVGKTQGGGAPRLGSPVAVGEGGGRGGGGGGGGGGYNGTPFTAGRTPIKPPGGGGDAKSRIGPTNTGNTAVSNYGTPYGGGRAAVKKPDRILVDQRTLQDEQRTIASKGPSGAIRPIGDQGQAKSPLKIRPPQPKRDTAALADTGFSIGDFLRYLVIAAIVIALLLFLGGQALQIGKSMD